MAASTPSSNESNGKAPRTARGRQTMRKLLDAAAKEFGENGFHEASVSAITRRAGTALGSFYTYFDSKDAIFRALVEDMSAQVASRARDAIGPQSNPFEIERDALRSFLDFARENKEVYRIIDEAEFVVPASFREHYETTAARILQRLQKGEAEGSFHEGMDEAHAWALMGMNVFLGLRYAVWGEGADSERISQLANDMLRHGLKRE